jgi:hypothetical protein
MSNTKIEIILRLTTSNPLKQNNVPYRDTFRWQTVPSVNIKADKNIVSCFISCIYLSLRTFYPQAFGGFKAGVLLPLRRLFGI